MESGKKPAASGIYVYGNIFCPTVLKKEKQVLLDLKSKTSDFIRSYDTLIVFKKYKSMTLPEGIFESLSKDLNNARIFEEKWRL
ncbi:MAG: hypothetical protein ACE5DM_05250 [Candidatus Nanoarchaeia archaeon]